MKLYIGRNSALSQHVVLTYALPPLGTGYKCFKNLSISQKTYIKIQTK